jgi:hypothetical protein
MVGVCKDGKDKWVFVCELVDIFVKPVFIL